MAKTLTSKSRRQPKVVGDVNVHHGNAVEMGGFQHVRAGHEIARPTVLTTGEKALVTPSGRTFRTRKI